MRKIKPDLPKLIENFSVPQKMIRPVQVLTESMVSIKREGKTYSCLAAYTFPISRPGKENLNGRIYSKKLWNRVIKEGYGEGKFGLCDHPADDSEQPDGSVKDAFCVWHNLRYNEAKDLIVADAYLFGVHGQQMKDAIDAGGQPGFSTVGYGDYEEDNDKVIDADTYFLDRPADWVMNPSYEVFGSMEDEMDPNNPDHTEEPREEEPPKTPEQIKDTSSAKKEQTSLTGENSMPDTDKKKLTPLEERTLKIQLTNMVKESEKLPSLAEQKAELLTILSYFEEGVAPELKKDVETRIQALDLKVQELVAKGQEVPKLEEAKELLSQETVSLSEQLKTITEDRDRLQQELSQMREHYQRSLELNDAFKTFTAKMKEMYDLKKAEVNTRVSATDYKELLVYSEGLEQELDVLRAQLTANMEPARPATIDEPPVIPTSSQGYTGEVPLSAVPVTPPVESPLPVGAEALVTEPVPEEDEYIEPPQMAGGAGIGMVFTNDPAIGSYYEDLVRKNPKAIAIKEEIMRCKTLFEAQKTYLKLKSLVEDRDLLFRDSHKDLLSTGSSLSRSDRGTNREPSSAPAKALPLRKGFV